MKGKTLAAVTFFTVVSAIPAASQTLTVLVEGSGSVRGTGINCPSDCSETLVQPLSKTMSVRKATTVVLTAGGAFGGASGPNWGGVCNGTIGTTCTVTVPAGGATVSAVFATVSPPDISGGISNAMGVSSIGPGTISVSVSGTVQTYRAEPNAGVRFAGWSGGCSGIDPVCTRTVGGFPSSVTARFGWPLTVMIDGPGGRVTGAGIDCPTVCYVVAVPPTLILDATAAANGSLKEWGGDCKTEGATTSGARCSLSVTGPKNVTARFQVTLLTPPPPP